MTTQHKDPHTVIEMPVRALEAVKKTVPDIGEYATRSYTTLEQVVDAALTAGREVLATQWEAVAWGGGICCWRK